MAYGSFRLLDLLINSGLWIWSRFQAIWTLKMAFLGPVQSYSIWGFRSLRFKKNRIETGSNRILTGKLFSSQILTVLLDYFKGDILVVLSLSGCEIPPSSFSSLSGLGILAFLGFFSIWFLSLRTLQSEMLKDRLHL
ncbi:unnamed protein product [Rhizophagus irregularis]|uniref:Uncharacterized protein n=1 Tax=Rhizophagus irregularis TaxID=588596 RepID=A0A915ZYB5_9GLOM|nr:unnamed protein product [Rhizophagus irregularis]